MARRTFKALLKSVFGENAWEYIREVYWRLWDAWHRGETSRIVEIAALSVVGKNHAHGYRYQPAGSIRKILKDLRIDYGKYGFIDFGSGKGRVLLQAAEFPFKSVEGVEFCIELHRIAENNIRQYRRGKLRCGVLKSNLADAAEFPPPAIPLVLFIHNPFSTEILASLLGNVRRSVVEHPRDVVIICAGKTMQTDYVEGIPNILVLWRRENFTAFRMPR